MLQFEYVDSEFYGRNKIRCEKIEEQLLSSGYEVNGYCNAWGYEINAFKADSQETITIVNGSNTNGGIVAIIADASEFNSFNYKENLKNNSLRLKYESSVLLRYFMNAEYKQMIPNPYYIKTNKSLNYGQINTLEKLRNNSKSFEMKIEKGVIKVSFNDKVEDIQPLLDRIEKFRNSL